MALYNDLPVYKASYDVLLLIFEYCKTFTREYKYTIGEKLKNETLEMLMNIYRANSTEHKQPFITKAREHVEVIRLLLRITKDLKQINIKKFVQINEQIENVSRQLTGWQRSVDKK